MKKISYTLTGLGILLFLTACRKEKNEESIWYIDGVKHSSRDMERTVAYNPPTNSYTIALQYGNYMEGIKAINIGLVFYGIEFPQSGTFTIRTNTDTIKDGFVDIGYKQQLYNCSLNNTGTIVASSYKGLAKYEIAPVWFKSGNGDSILFSGTFYEPIKEQ